MFCAGSRPGYYPRQLIWGIGALSGVLNCPILADFVLKCMAGSSGRRFWADGRSCWLGCEVECGGRAVRAGRASRGWAVEATSAHGSGWVAWAAWTVAAWGTGMGSWAGARRLGLGGFRGLLGEPGPGESVSGGGGLCAGTLAAATSAGRKQAGWWYPSSMGVCAEWWPRFIRAVSHWPTLPHTEPIRSPPSLATPMDLRTLVLALLSDPATRPPGPSRPPTPGAFHVRLAVLRLTPPSTCRMPPPPPSTAHRRSAPPQFSPASVKGELDIDRIRADRRCVRAISATL